MKNLGIIGMVAQLPPDNPDQIIYPDSDGQWFLDYLELDRLRETERQRADSAEAELQALRNLLKAKGVNPEQL